VHKEKPYMISCCHHFSLYLHELAPQSQWLKQLDTKNNYK